MPKRKCSFNEDLQKRFPSFKRGKSDSEVTCLICESSISIASRGAIDIEEHQKTAKHKKRLQSQGGTSRILDTFVKKSSTNEKRVAAEGAIAYHTIRHHMSFSSLDCTLKLNKILFNDSQIAKEMTCNRTKATAIVTGVLNPHSSEKIKDDLKNVSCVSVSCDASNHGATKLIPVLIQYFDYRGEGISSKILDIETVPDETAETLVNLVNDQLRKYNITEKCVAFSGDNCNTNFGGRQRVGTNNVFFKLKEKLSKDIIGIGCPAHVLNNAVHHGCDILPIEVELIIVKIYNHFSTYTVRTEKLRQFCTDAEMEFTQLQSHSKTRWLSLFPAIEKLLKYYEPLRAYFLSLEKPPQFIIQFFNNEYAEGYLFLVHSIMSVIHTNIERVERKENSVVEVRKILEKVISLLDERITNKFCPLKIKSILKKLEDDGKDTHEFHTKIKDFYNEINGYIKMWIVPFKDLTVFDWIDLTGSDWQEWSNVEKSLAFLKDHGIEINDEKLFDEWVNLKNFSQNLDSTEKDNNLNFLWLQYFKQCVSEEQYVELRKVVEYVFCIPGHNANVERVFSLLNTQWSKERNRLLPATVAAIIKTTYNMNMNCETFYNYLLTQPQMLKDICGVEKYNKNKE